MFCVAPDCLRSGVVALCSCAAVAVLLVIISVHHHHHRLHATHRRAFNLSINKIRFNQDNQATSAIHCIIALFLITKLRGALW